MITSQKVKKRLSARRWIPPLTVNSTGSTPTPARSLIALGLMMDFLQVHHFLNPSKKTINRPFF